MKQSVSARKEMLIARLSKPFVIKRGKGKVLHFFSLMNVERSFYFSLNIEITNTLYESHRHSKKNGIHLNRLLRNENPCQTEFIHIGELHTKKSHRI